MPFTNADGEVPPPPVTLRFLSAPDLRRAYQAANPGGPFPASLRQPVWQLVEPILYLSPEGEMVTVPAQNGQPWVDGQSTDLASIPTVLWSLLAPYGRQLRPALLHDYECYLARLAPLREEGELIRRAADARFRESLRSEGVEPVRAAVFWAGVSAARMAAFHLPRLVMLVLSVFGAWGVLLHAWFHHHHCWPTWSVVALVSFAVLAAISARREFALLVVIGWFVFLPLLALTVVSFLTSRIAVLPDLVWWVVSGLRRWIATGSWPEQEVPSPGPTVQVL